MDRDSDLRGLPLILGVVAAVALVFAAFFFVGAVAGVVTLLAMTVLGLVAGARFIRAEDESD